MVRGIVLTHGHEDHIGGLPWILSELNVPVYGTEFTLAYVEGKLEEHRLLDDAELIEILPGRRFNLGVFSYHANPRDTLARRLCLRWPFTRQWEWCCTPGTSRSTFLLRMAIPSICRRLQISGNKAFSCLLQDSTNVDRTGFTPGEKAVIPRLDEIFGSYQEEALLLLLFVVDSSHQDCDGSCAQTRS
jgi:ribonuclease J